MLSELIAKAVKRRFLLAPIIGVGCPGLFKSDGTIERGAQNLPGNWEAPDFNLPHQLQSALPEIGGHTQRVSAQRCGCAGPERTALYGGDETLGRADDRDRARQRTLQRNHVTSEFRQIEVPALVP
jgi:hypothetical protein